MPLEIRRKPDGVLKSKYWYGAFAVGGKRFVKNLGVEIEGRPPVSLRDDGDGAFERSRGKAKEKLEQLIADARGTKSAEALVQELHEIKYGAKIESFPVADLVKAWESMPKKRRTVNPRYAKDVKATVRRFIEFVTTKFPDAKDAAQVDRRIAREFMESEEERGVADKTWNDSLKRIRATFRFLQSEYGLWRNPFDGLRMREENHLHRKPLTEAQIVKLLEVVANDEFCRPLIVCGLSTAMRLGDCCTLRWADVDMTPPTPSVTVKTSKTGETVCIPIYERLRCEIEAARGRAKEGSEFVWPDQAALYLHAHSLVSRKVGRVFRKAVGKNNVHVVRKHGMLKGSVIDFHSLRTTWITEALSRGVPIETVKLVSGHKTVEVVTTHYFHPSREQVRNALNGALPVMLTGGETKVAGLLTEGRGECDHAKGPGEALEEALKVLENMKPRSWMEQRDTVVGFIKQAKEWMDTRAVSEVREGK
ncbi:MAG: tyrosine-type recombinase/integrase [Kiritimatiellae bacterium]|nr:tyrosine-type recombinase/integrase [Kiritimatiellia bacterium]